MSKKAKGVVSGGFVPMSLDDKARFKSQTLLLEYQDLQKETYGARMKLDVAKQKRKELLAEVRFLQKRHRYLSMERPTEQQSNIVNQNELTNKGRKLHKSEAARFKLPPLPEKKPNGRDYAATASKNIIPNLSLNHNKLASQSGNWKGVASRHNLKDVNYRKNNGAALRDTFHLDLNLDNGGGVVRKEEAVFPIRIPTFDLNEVSMEEEEEEVQVDDELGKLEESKWNMIRTGGYEEQVNDMKISSSLCRNNSGEGGGGGASRIGKRKISWQDPLALRV